MFGKSEAVRKVSSGGWPAPGLNEYGTSVESQLHTVQLGLPSDSDSSVQLLLLTTGTFDA
jgi:hypothetical protein